MTTPTTRLTLIRHGESNSTVARVIGGPRTCSGLSELGRLQATRLADRLRRTGETPADALYASAYPRAAETAAIIAPALQLGVQTESGVGEHDPGPLCDGMSYAAFVERFGSPKPVLDAHVPYFEQGESLAAFHHRVGLALSIIRRRHEDQHVVVVCHGGVIDAALRLFLGLPMSGGFETHTLNTSLTELAIAPSGVWRMIRYNDAAHLEGLPSETERSPEIDAEPATV